MITAITTSKLFVTSSRQKSIMAAMENPINAELVQQLSEYLSDDSKEDLAKAVSSNTPEDNAGVDAQDNSLSEQSDLGNDDGFSGGSTPSQPSGFSGGAASSGNVFDDFDDFDSESENTPVGDAPVSESPTDSAPVEESRRVNGIVITGNTEPQYSFTFVQIPDTNVIKGTLNANSDTCGVNRIELIDSELWIYYEDEVNLNDIMISVIELLNASGYTCLKFNRLGRSNNAIIFDVKQECDEVKSTKEIEEKT